MNMQQRDTPEIETWLTIFEEIYRNESIVASMLKAEKEGTRECDRAKSIKRRLKRLRKDVSSLISLKRCMAKFNKKGGAE